MKSVPGQKNVEGLSGKKDGGLKNVSIFYCCGWLFIHMSWRDGQIQARNNETLGISQAYFRHITNLFLTYLRQL